MMSLNLSNISILNISGVDYGCIINEISKSEVENLLQKSGKKKVEQKSGTYRI